MIYAFSKKNDSCSNEVIIQQSRSPSTYPSTYPNTWPNFNQDPLLNPYTPPLRDESYFRLPARLPVNISTNPGAVDANYRQMGLLTPLQGESKDNILPLMGRPLFTNRDKWQYYSTSNQHNNVKLPLIKHGRSCTNEYGCDSLFSGDIVFVEGIGERYKVTLYDNATFSYVPMI